MDAIVSARKNAKFRGVRLAAMLVVLAALPLPFLLYGGIAVRSDLVWLFVTHLVVAILATFWIRRGPGTEGRWSFQRDREED